MKNLILPIVFLTLVTCGCASILSKSDYPVSFNSNPSGAKIKITRLKDGKILYQGQTPTTVTLKSKAGFFSPAKYNVEFSFPNGIRKNIVLTASLDGWYIGNIIFGGLIGLLIIDPATGAMWKLPPSVSVSMDRTSSLIFKGRKLKIVMLKDLPNELRSRLILIKP